MAKDKQPDHRAAGSADTPPTGVACAVAGNAETAAADWRTDLETALRERDAVLPVTTVARVNQALAYAQAKNSGLKSGRCCVARTQRMQIGLRGIPRRRRPCSKRWRSTGKQTFERPWPETPQCR